jgi:AbiV family abortive infection protein
MPRKKAIEQYRGRLTPDLIAAGMNAAAANSKRLLDDAEALFSAGRYPSACSLAILSIEEAGKLSLLRALATAPSEKDIRDAWRNYRDHQTKNASWIIQDLVIKGARTLNDLASIFDADSDHPAVLDTIKQLGFYTDCYGNSHWSEPHEAIDKDLAASIIHIAGVLRPRRTIPVREIELWIEHLAPVWGTPAMVRASVAFHRAMQQEGLSAHTPKEIEEFYGMSRLN